MSATDTVIILQARLGSTRLPGKALLPLGNSTLFGWCVSRLQKTGLPLVVALPDNPLDDRLQEVAQQLGIDVVRGPEQDVLQRFLMVLDRYPCTYAIRATADNPFVDWQLTIHLLEKMRKNAGDYLIGQNYPYGTTTEVIRSSVLQDLASHKDLGKRDREHVTIYLREHPEAYRILHDYASHSPSEFNLTVDTQNEYDRAVRLVRQGITPDSPVENILTRMCLRNSAG